jgi:hypothetical protein
MTRISRTAAWLTVVLLGIGLVISLLLYCAHQKSRFSATIANGEQITAALERFHSDRGRYPDALSELRPAYLVIIPPATWGIRSWVYMPDLDRGGYALQVNESMRTGDGNAHWLRYDSQVRRWKIGD